MIAVKGPVIGIDLGTVNSCVATVENERPRVITSSEGYETIPSVLFLDKEDRIFVGHKATERMILEPDSAVYGSKRFLGRPFASREVKTLGHFFAYDLVEGKDGRTAAKIRDHVVALEDVGAHILASLKKMAEHYMDCDVVRAVITVPAYFGETQRYAVREAGRMAGFYVERVLNEPTAAAVAYGYGKGLKKTVLIYDLGGGTFDASVLRINGDQMEVLATDGDPFLGGSDFDDRLTEYVLQGFEKENGVKIRQDMVAIQRVRFACEMAKKQLSSAQSATVDVPYIASKKGNHLDLHASITREKFESLTRDLVTRTLDIVERVLSDAEIKANKLDDVLLVGGQTRSPQVHELIAERFGMAPSKNVHPEEAVARGAAIIAGAVEQKIQVQLTDILPTSIQLGAADGKCTPLLPKGTRLPMDTEFDIDLAGARRGLTVSLYRGEKEFSDQNQFLGLLRFPALASSAVATAKLSVKLSISVDGLLTVSARHPLTGETKELDVSLSMD
jgi:molecular chaperone DnaK